MQILQLHGFCEAFVQSGAASECCVVVGGCGLFEEAVDTYLKPVAILVVLILRKKSTFISWNKWCYDGFFCFCSLYHKFKAICISCTRARSVQPVWQPADFFWLSLASPTSKKTTFPKRDPNSSNQSIPIMLVYIQWTFLAASRSQVFASWLVIEFASNVRSTVVCLCKFASSAIKFNHCGKDK